MAFEEMADFRAEASKIHESRAPFSAREQRRFQQTKG